MKNAHIQIRTNGNEELFHDTLYIIIKIDYFILHDFLKQMRLLM